MPTDPLEMALITVLLVGLPGLMLLLGLCLGVAISAHRLR